MIIGFIYVGNAMLLSYDPTWERLLDYYKYYGCKVEGSTFPLHHASMTAS